MSIPTAFGSERGGVVFQVIGASIRSRLNAVLTLTDTAGHVLAQGNVTGSRPEPLLGYRFTTTGTSILQIRDFENAGGPDVYYRLNVARVPGRH